VRRVLTERHLGIPLQQSASKIEGTLLSSVGGDMLAWRADTVPSAEPSTLPSQGQRGPAIVAAKYRWAARGRRATQSIIAGRHALRIMLARTSEQTVAFMAGGGRHIVNAAWQGGLAAWWRHQSSAWRTQPRRGADIGATRNMACCGSFWLSGLPRADRTCGMKRCSLSALRCLSTANNNAPAAG